MALDHSLGQLFIRAARHSLGEGMRKIEHCLGQLSDEQVWWRPGEGMNSIANLMLHLSGNMRQWIIAAAMGAKDVRNRPAEFADRSGRPKGELMRVLKGVVEEADGVLAKLTDAELASARRVQAYDVTLLAALFDTVAHFRGHVQEIIHMTREQLGEKYRFDFVPTAEQEKVMGPGV